MPVPGERRAAVCSSAAELAPQEVAAIAAVLAVLDGDRRRLAAWRTAEAEQGTGAQVGTWVLASRLRGRRATLERGPWRLAPRLGPGRTP